MKFLKNLTILLSIMSAALCTSTASIAAPSPQNSDAAIGQTLCGMLDLSRPDMAAVKKADDAGNYADALDAWRDYQVEKLRRSSLGIMSFHSNRINPIWLATADRLIGKTTQAQYRASYSGRVGFYDIYGISGDPNAPQTPIQWLATSPDPVSMWKVDYSNFYFAAPLASDYWKTGDADYLKKWFEIAGDFSVNQKRMIESAGPQVQKTFVANWSTEAQPALSQGDRVQNMIASLAVFAKSLPGVGKPTNWDDVGKPVSGALAPGSVQMIPAADLAEVAISMVQDEPQALEQRYLNAGAVPNQRRNGITALLQIAIAFDEFKAASTVSNQASGAMTDYINGAVYPDGGMLEQSFNYNEGDAGNLVLLESLVQDKYPALASLLKGKTTQFYRCLAALTMPAGGLPTVGNSHLEAPPQLWTEPDDKAQKIARYGSATQAPDPLALLLAPGKSEPDFISIAFPYSGYYAMRNGWKWDSSYLFFMAARPARGHSEHDNNAIQVEAYGRPMLVAGGPPPYTVSFLTPSNQPDFNAINDYLGESSSWKTNTVVVDGKSQSRDMPVALHVYPNTIQHPWITTAHFDYVENLYDLGYGDAYNSYTKGLKIDNSVAHERQVIFVRDANLWIVTDHMINKKPGTAHAFTQIWNIAPRIDDPKHPVSGYTNDQVMIDSAQHAFHTGDPSGPNLWLYSFGAPELTYDKIYAQKNPYRGWFARGIGDLQPMTTVDVDWKGGSDTLLATIIAPSRNAASSIASASDLTPKGDPAQTAFTANLTGGGKLAYFCATTPHAFSAGDIKAEAKTLLIEQVGGETRGIALGCTSLSAGNAALKPAEADFVWEQTANGAIQIVAPITAPQGFTWEKTNSGSLTPSYAAIKP